MDKTEQQNKKPPFPALTSAQRLHFEIYGYVVIEKMLDANEVARIRDALQNLKRRFEATGNPYHTSYKGCSASGKEYAWAGPRLHFNHLIKADAAFLTYATYPRIVGIAQEVVGCEVRLSESQAIINSRHPEVDANNPPAYIFHHQWLRRAAYTEHGLHHFGFVKVLTNLTDIGPRRRWYCRNRRFAQAACRIRADGCSGRGKPVPHPSYRSTGGFNPSVCGNPSPCNGSCIDRS